jgi:aspartate carbamoyltransferase catalytic subunit
MGSLPLKTDTGRELQRDHAGRLRHLLTLAGLTRDELNGLLDFAQFYVRHPGDMAARDGSLAGRTVANLFFEPSTRTRVSFELAAKRLGADVVNLDMQSSSRVKGETVLDTIYTLQAMHVDVFVMRDSEPGIPAFVAAHVQPHVSVLNAGEAHVSHPTQGLLDVLTIRQRKGVDFGSLCVAIVGDIRHSRVARSSGTALQTLGVGELRLVSPESLMPGVDELPGARRFSALDEGLRGADVVMALRIQKERMDTSQIPDVDAFLREWGITDRTIGLAHRDAIVLHPGPMNRGVEITNEIADGPQSAVQQQVRNGVAVRMAVLATIVRNVQLRNVEAGRRAG